MGNTSSQPSSDEPRDKLPPLERLRRDLPLPTAVFRRRAWREFQRALDPLAPPRPPPRHRH